MYTALFFYDPVKTKINDQLKALVAPSCILLDFQTSSATGITPAISTTGNKTTFVTD